MSSMCCSLAPSAGALSRVGAASTRVVTATYTPINRVNCTRYNYLSSVKAIAEPIVPRVNGKASSQPNGVRRERGMHVVAGNPGAGGPFAPIVRVTRNIMGVKEFNKLRGKAISLHSQVIKDFCKQIGADPKQVQGLIRLAKKNGEKLGFLA